MRIKAFILKGAVSALGLITAFSAFGGLVANAATTATTVKTAPLVYAAWLPFWQQQPGQEDIAVHLDSLQEISPFSYELGPTGNIIDDLGINNGSWSGWLSAVHDFGTKVYPTIAWFDTANLYKLLSSTKNRQAEEGSIAALAKAQKFDGIDIDFEGMNSATRPYFSLFIQGLSQRLHAAGRKLTCSVVPRTPPADLYGYDSSSSPVYAENYTNLNTYCDEVRLEAYDQGPIDITLNAQKGNGTLYAPVADPAWAKLVINQALQYISPKKIMLGVPTYGYEYETSWSGGILTYQRVRSFGFYGAMDRADSLSLAPVRDNADELSFTFTSSTYIAEPSILVSTVPSAMPSILASVDPSAPTTFFVSFPDAQSVSDKIALARQYGLRGIALFKADGQMDPAIWGIMK